MKIKKEIILIIGLIVILCFVIAAVKIKENRKKALVDKKTNIYIALGSGKDNFLEDDEVKNIIKNRYGLNVTYDNWSNSKLIKESLVRKNGSGYDAMFTSDERYYEYYKQPADEAKGEAQRNTVYKGGKTLNTPIVIYTWDTMIDTLLNEKIITAHNDVYYITDMSKLLGYISEEKKWSELGIEGNENKVTVETKDPKEYALGEKYYELLLYTMCGENVTNETVDQTLPKLKELYKKTTHTTSGTNLFKSFIQAGSSKKAMIADYEKSIIQYAYQNPEDWEKVKDKVKILYPTPTIWTSHCIATFTENGNKFYEALTDKDVEQIAWNKYGFRTATTGVSYDVTQLGITGIPQTIDSTAFSIKMDLYEKMMNSIEND